jgi:hypothetical protein
VVDVLRDEGAGGHDGVVAERDACRTVAPAAIHTPRPMWIGAIVIPERRVAGSSSWPVSSPRSARMASKSPGASAFSRPRISHARSISARKSRAPSRGAARLYVNVASVSHEQV